MGRIVTLALLLIVAGCATAPTNPSSWLSDEYFERLPEGVENAYVQHVRGATAQEHPGLTFVDEYSADQILDLASLWCEQNPSRFSRVIGNELAKRDVDISPGRDFLPPPPIDRIMTQIADRHQPALCEALG